MEEAAGERQPQCRVAWAGRDARRELQPAPTVRMHMQSPQEAERVAQSAEKG